MFIVAIILAAILGVAFISAGVMKLTGAEAMADAPAHLGISPGLWRIIAILEILGGVGVVLGLAGSLGWLGIAAGVGLALMGDGAFIYHKRAGDGPGEFMPAIMMSLVACAYVLFRYLSL